MGPGVLRPAAGAGAFSSPGLPGVGREVAEDHLRHVATPRILRRAVPPRDDGAAAAAAAADKDRLTWTRESLGEASEGAVEAPSELQTNELRDPLAVIRRVAEGELRRLGALEIQVQVVLPREADAAVELDPGRRDLAVRVGGVRLGHGHGEGRPRGAPLPRP